VSRRGLRIGRIFYGWYIIIAAFLVATIGNGLQYSFGVFLKPLSQEFDWSRSLTAGAFMFYMICRAFSGILMGGLSDKYGPRIIVGLGGFLMGLGMLLGASIGSPWQLYLFYGGFIGIGMGVAGAPLWATVSRWFVAGRGRALGLMASGAGVGNVIVSPVAAYFIRNFGLSTAYLVIGAISLFALSISALVLRKEPGDLGLKPYGAPTGAGAEGVNLDGKKPGESSDWTISQALHSRSFKLLAGSGVSFGVGFFILVTNIVAHATDLGVSGATAPYLLSIIGGSGAIGMVITGRASDKVGARQVLIASFLLQGGVLLWLTAVSGFTLFCVACAIFGFGYGGVMPQFPGITAELFGLRSLGGILGILSLTWLLGGAVGAELGNLIYDLTKPHSYILAFWLGGAVFMVGALFLLLMIKPRRS
jgi:MFS family permease